jgi:hypothetical protein
MQLRSLLSTVAALGLTALAGLGLATPALASTSGTYAPESDSAAVSASTVAPGGAVTVRGDGFLPGSIVTLTVSQGGKVYLNDTARASGGGQSFAAAASGNVGFTVHPTEAGNNVIRLIGQQADGTGTRVLSVNINVRATATATGATSGSGLPGTGGVNLTPLWAGLGLLGAGTLLVGVAHSRRRILI